MCGLLLEFSKTKINKKQFKNSLDLLSHRGPDNNSILKINKNLILGHTRLSIQDLSKCANQPMIEEEGCSIIFNGEIYNFKKLKKELLDLGEVFLTSSDTEVLIKYLKIFGVEGIRKLNGMWAFIFVNHNSGLIIISRDRFGKKPLYYNRTENGYIFSSEIKSIFHITKSKRILEKEFLSTFVYHAYWPNCSNKTFYKEILQVMPGEVITTNFYDESFNFESNFDNSLNNSDFETELSNVKDIIFDSTKKRLISDVKTGIFLSGGVDSSIVASNAIKINKKIDWLAGETLDGQDNLFTKILAKDLEINVNNIPINYGISMVDRLKKMTKIYEFPIPFIGNSIGMNLMYETASSLGIKVILDGTGGDEIFGGYFDYYLMFIFNSYIKKYSVFGIFKFLFDIKPHKHLKLREILRYLYLRYVPRKLFWKKIKKLHPYSKIERNSSLKDFQIYDCKYGRLQMWIKMNDLNSMMYSVESRSPLLDIRLFKEIFNQDTHKFKKGFNKYLLRQCIPKTVSDEIRWRSDKQGFRYSGKRFYTENKKHIIDTIENCGEIKKLREFDLEKRNYSEFNHINLNLYMVALLVKEYDCEIN